MELYVIRLKNHPHLFVGKSNSSYAIKSDHEIDNWHWPKDRGVADRVMQIDAHWFKTETYAKVWTSLSVLKQFLSYCTHEDDKTPTFSQYELLLNGSVVPFPVI